MDAVRADHQIGADGAAVVESQLDLVLTLLDVRTAQPQPDDALRQQFQQTAVQVGAVRQVVRGPEQLLALGTERSTHDRVAVVPAVHLDRARAHRDGAQVVGEAEPVQQPGRVRRDLDAGAHLGEVRRLFEHLASQPGAGECRRHGEPRDAGAHDGDPQFVSHRNAPNQ